MVRHKFLATTIILIFSLLACDAEPPPQEHFPLIKEKLLALQDAVRDKDMAALDSLISVEMIKIKLDKDSLINFIYGADNSYAFERFGNYEIRYTSDKARVDCYLMDSTGTMDRPATLTFILEDDDRWLLKRFEAGHP